MSDFETILVESDAAVLTITINRPDKLNALNEVVLRELTRAVYDASRGTARAAIVTGAGTKAFVAGADIAAMSAMTASEAKAFSDAGHRLAWHIEQAAIPFIAAVNGFALGGGCELALACDFAIASENAKFGQPEVNLGLMPGFGGTQRLSRRIGVGHARELIYTGDTIDAARALELGLVNTVVPQGELLSRAKAIATKIASKGPLAIASCKRVIARGADADLVGACELEASAFAGLFGTEDAREGTKAFVEKRPAKFTGR